MKQWIVICVLGVLICSCADTKKVAPTEGRISLVQSQVLTASKSAIKLDQPVTITQSLMLYQNAQNQRSHYTLKGNDNWSQDSGHSQLKNGPALPSPVVNKQSVFTLDSAFYLARHQKADGHRVWRKKLQDNQVGVSLIQQDNTLYALSQSGLIVATDLDGKILWQKDMNAPFRNGLVSDSKYLYLLSASNDLWVLNRSDGSIHWHYRTNMPQTTLYSMAQVASSSGITVVPFLNGEVMAFDSNTGAFIWSQDMNAQPAFNQVSNITQMTAAPVIHKQKVFLLGHNNLLLVLDLKTGDILWSLDVGGDLTPVINGNTLFVLTNQHKLMALDISNGRLFWEQNISDVKAVDNFVLVNHQLWLIGEQKIICVNATNGHLDHIVDISEYSSVPVWTSQGMYLFQEDGTLLHQGQF